MSFENNEIIERANINDVNEITNLYRLVYGKRYPISYGNDIALLKRSIKNEKTHLVIVARALSENVVTGVLITEIDKENKIGKLVGLVVHPTYQKNKIGNHLVEYVGNHFLEKGNELNSLYATTRTNTV